MKRAIIFSFFGFFIFGLFCGALGYKFFNQGNIFVQEKSSCSLNEEVDLEIPVQMFLQRVYESQALSMVRKVYLGNWISNNQNDVITILRHVRNVKNFKEFKSELKCAMNKEQKLTNACAIINAGLDIIESDSNLIKKINIALSAKTDQEVMRFRDLLLESMSKFGYVKNKESEKIKKEYRKALLKMFDKQYGNLIEAIVVKV